MQAEVASRGWWRAALVCLTAALIAGLALWVVTPVGHAEAEPLPRLISGRGVYFPATGQTMSGAFLRKWILELNELEVGQPVTPVVQVGDAYVQWTEYGRLEYRGPDVNLAQPEEIVRVPIGRLYAEKLGYSRWVPAFKPIDAAGTEARFFYETRHSLANDFLRHYERPGYDQRLGAPISEEFRIGAITYQFFEYGALAWDPVEGTRIVPLGRLDASINGYGTPQDDFRPGDIYYTSDDPFVLGDAFGERWIEIDLSEYEIIAWAGDFELLRSKVVTGPVQAPTPTGDFEIYIRYEVQDLSGISWTGRPYYSPGTPWVMYFYQDYAIHGSTWRDSYGFGDGEGCVIPPNDVAEKLWKWADYGTRVWVHY